MQDTFVALWKDARRFRHDGEVGAWLWGIAFRRMVSRLRSRQDVVLIPEWDVSPAPQQVLPSAEDQVLLGVEYGDLASALRRLSPEFRSVVQAVVLDGLTTKEAGRLLGVRENTVKTRLHRAKAQLRPRSPSRRRDGDDHRDPGWHADPALLSSYLAGTLDAVTGASVEQHVNRCETLPATVGPLLEPQLVERTWAGIRDAVERPPLPFAVRLARRVGLPEPTAVLLAAAGLAARCLAGRRLPVAVLRDPRRLRVRRHGARRRSSWSHRSRRCSGSPPPTARARTRSRRWSPPRRTGAPG